MLWTLHIVYIDKQSNFKELFGIDSSTTAHVRNLQYLMAKIFKVKKGISPSVVGEIFEFTENPYYNLRSGEV